MKIEDKSLENAKRRFFISLAFLAAGIIYVVWPVDFIPDFIGPVGWVDDLTALFSSAAYCAVSYYRLKKASSSESESEKG